MIQRNKNSQRKKTRDTATASIKSKKYDVTVGSTICHKYLLTKFINEGSFGKIYVAHNTATEVDYAAKIEVLRYSDSKFYETLVREAKILFELKGQLGFPKMIYFLKDSRHSFMIITLLSDNLEDIFNLCKKQFTLYTVLFLAIQMLARLEALHLEGYIHRDIKPDNFLFGLEEKHDLLHLIDFGLSKKYLDNDGKHIPFKKNLSMVGTPRYTSIHSHLGYEHSRRDDLESLGYIMIMFAKGNLPWMNIKIESKSEKHKRIAEIKMTTSNEDLCDGLPKEFLYYMNHVKNLNFTDKPNYDYLKGLFRDLNKNLFTGKNITLDWMKLNDYTAKLQLVRKDTDKKKNVHYLKTIVTPPPLKLDVNFNKKFLSPQKSLQVERITMPQSPTHSNNKSLDRLDSNLSRKNDMISEEEVKLQGELKELNVIDEKSSSSGNSIYVNDDCDKNEKKEINEFEDKFLVNKNAKSNDSEDISTTTKDKNFTSNKFITRSTSQEFEKHEKHSENISDSILNEYQDCNQTMTDFIKKLKINKIKFLNEI